MKAKSMKKSLAIRTALAVVLATAVYLGDPGNIAQAQAQNTAPLPYGATEVLKMYQGGISKETIIEYINSSALPYRLNADAIIYLKTVGVPQEITKAMLVREGQLEQQQAAPQQNYAAQPPMQAANPPNPYGSGVAPQPPMQNVVVPTTPAPQVTVVGADYPAVYDYGYPYYGYAGGYWPGYYGVGWGWGWGGWGGHWGYGGFHGGYGGFHGGGGGFHGGGHR